MESPSFIVSVILPIYNTEKYLSQTFHSLETQTIGFLQNIQVIIINDGSTDNSQYHCKTFQQQYPGNVIYIQQSNMGVSAARNVGLDYVKGKYVVFFDSDDLWSSNAFEDIYSFFEKHYLDVDVVAARIKMFDAYEGYQEIDYKFSETKLINLQKDYKYIQMAVHSTFIKASAIKETDRFSVNLKYGEDTAFINTILLKKCMLGVVREAEYYHRKRKDKSSALNKEAQSPSYLFDSPIYYHQALFNRSINMYGIVLRFIQYTVMYEIKWRLPRSVTFLSDGDYRRYCTLIITSLQAIDDDIILEQTGTPLQLKLFTLSKKHGRDIREQLYIENGTILYQSIPLLRIADSNTLLRCQSIQISRNTLNLKCVDTNILSHWQYRYALVSDIRMISSVVSENTAETIPSMFGKVDISRQILFHIKLNRYSSIKLHPIILLSAGSDKSQLSLTLGISHDLPRLTKVFGNHKIVFNSEGIIITPSNYHGYQLIKYGAIFALIYHVGKLCLEKGIKQHLHIKKSILP